MGKLKIGEIEEVYSDSTDRPFDLKKIQYFTVQLLPAVTPLILVCRDDETYNIPFIQ